MMPYPSGAVQTYFVQGRSEWGCMATVAIYTAGAIHRIMAIELD